MVGKSGRNVTSIEGSPVIEQHTIGVTIVELRLHLAIDGRYLNRAFRQSAGNGEGDVTDVKLLNVNLPAADRQGERRVGIVNEVVTVDGSLFASLCPLVAHVVDGGAGHQHLEVVGRGVVGVVNHENLVVHHTGNLTRYGDNHRIIGNETGNQLGLLVVEEHLGDATEVLTYDTDVVVHVGTRQQRVGTLYIHGAYVADGG